MKNLSFFLAVLAVLTVQSTHLSARTLIASFSFSETTADATGDSSNIILTNTPYDEGLQAMCLLLQRLYN